MNGDDWSLPPPDEISLWRGERPPVSLLLTLSFSVVTTILGFVVALVEPLTTALLHPASLLAFALVAVTFVVLRNWSRTRYEITSMRVIQARGDDVTQLFIHELSSVTVERGSWATILGVSRFVIRSPDDQVRWTWVLNAEDALASLDRAMGGHGLGPEIVRKDEDSVMYMPVRRAREKPTAATPERIGDVELPSPRLHPATLVGPAIGVIVLAGFMVAGALRHDTIRYPEHDAIYPLGVKRSREEIVAFMKSEVLPFAKRKIGPLVGGEDEVTCETCHGHDAEARGYRMPAVKALPEPHVLETISEGLRESDSQVQTAVYGYLAAPEKLETMRIMRNEVLPGMAELLGRPAWDFTKPLSYNRESFAFGCYHCHRLDDRRR